MDHFITSQSGRCVVQSCGNYRGRSIHTSGRVWTGEAKTIPWIVDAADLTPNELEIWYSSRDELAVTVSGPGVHAVAVGIGEVASIDTGAGEIGRAYHRASDPNNGRHHVDLFLGTRAPAGVWNIGLTGVDVVDGRFDGWVERDSHVSRMPIPDRRLDRGRSRHHRNHLQRPAHHRRRGVRRRSLRPRSGAIQQRRPDGGRTCQTGDACARRWSPRRTIGSAGCDIGGERSRAQERDEHGGAVRHRHRRMHVRGGRPRTRRHGHSRRTDDDRSAPRRRSRRRNRSGSCRSSGGGGSGSTRGFISGPPRDRFPERSSHARIDRRRRGCRRPRGPREALRLPCDGV